MRNLKKVLSLVLCLAMMLSIMVVGAGAAFGDQDKIENAEAVDMCVALGIIDGFEDGNYHPEKNITRAQAAKLICVMLNGGKDAVKDAAASSFTDVLTDSTSAWASKYIEFCSAEGIVAGVGGGRFAPASNVTGTQLAKMLLVALGYDADKEGFVGSAWALKVNTAATKAGLYKGLEDIDVSAALSRDDAAQMIWNALNADTVVYLTSSTGALTYGNSLLWSVFGAEVDTGILTKIAYNRDLKEYTYTIGGEEYTSTADYTDLYAMSVSVLAKGNDALLVRLDKGGAVVSGVIGDIGGINNDHFNTITVNGVKYRLDNVAKDAEEVWDITVAYNDYSNEYFDGDVKVQYAFTAIDQDGGGDIDKIVVYPYVVLKTTNVLTDSFKTNIISRHDANMTVKGCAQDARIMASLGIKGQSTSNVVEFDDVQVNGTVERNGYVQAIPAQFTAQGEDIYNVLDIKSAAATSLNTRDIMVTLGSTEYDGNLLEQIDAFKQISLNKAYGYVEVNGYLFIMDGTGIVPAIDQYTVATKVAAYPEGADGTYQTDLLLTTGETIRVDATDPAIVGSLYTYEINDDGYYELTAVRQGTAAPTGSDFDVQQAYKTGATLNNDWSKKAGFVNPGVPGMYGTNTAGGYFKDYTRGSSNTFNIEDDAVIFVYNRMMDSYSVVKGSDLENVSTREITWAFTGATEKVAGNATVDLGYVAVSNDPDEVTVYAYVDSNAVRTTNEDGKYVIEVDVILANGETATLTTEGTVDQDNAKYQRLYACLTEGDLFKLIVDGTTLIDIKEYWVGEEVTVDSELYNSMITLDGDQYFVTSDTLFIPISGDADDIADIQKGETVTIVADGSDLTLVVY